MNSEDVAMFEVATAHESDISPHPDTTEEHVMKAGSVIRIPDAVASRAGGRETVQPGLPGRWSVWSQCADAPGAHFVVPIDEEARETGVKFATVRITKPRGETERVQLTATEPGAAMPKTHSAA